MKVEIWLINKLYTNIFVANVNDTLFIVFQEEVVLKRCWLARYWSLCVQHGKFTHKFNMWFSYLSWYIHWKIVAVVIINESGDIQVFN